MKGLYVNFTNLDHGSLPRNLNHNKNKYRNIQNFCQFIYIKNREPPCVPSVVTYEANYMDMLSLSYLCLECKNNSVFKINSPFNEHLLLTLNINPRGSPCRNQHIQSRNGLPGSQPCNLQGYHRRQKTGQTSQSVTCCCHSTEERLRGQLCLQLARLYSYAAFSQKA